MTNLFLINLEGDDRHGLIAAVSGALFGLGANLEDSGFHVIGTQYAFRAVAAFPDDTTACDIEDELAAIELISGSELSVVPFEGPIARETEGNVTHRVTVDGGDRPGLVARLSEILTDGGANIVRMHSEGHDKEGERRYLTRLHVHIPTDKVFSLDNQLTNTAGSMRLRLLLEAV